MTRYRRGFKTREAALAFQLDHADTAYCPLHPALRGSVYVVRDGVGGTVHVSSYEARSRAGDRRTYYASYVGA